jgi:hypothetical protein
MVRTYVCESQISLKTHSPVVVLTKHSPTVAETPRDSVIAQTICCAPPTTVEPAVRGRPVLGRGPEVGVVAGVPLHWGLHMFLGGIEKPIENRTGEITERVGEVLDHCVALESWLLSYLISDLICII